MKERHILFSAPMVRAILDGRKTQTRRIVSPQPTLDERGLLWWNWSKNAGSASIDRPGQPSEEWLAHCPHGQHGDRLWVKETFRFTSDFDRDSPSCVGERCLDAGYSVPWAPIQYEANGERRNWQWVGTPPSRDVTPGKTRVNIHMPRWASRILLEIVGVRVERLNDCSETDALAEGMERYFYQGYDFAYEAMSPALANYRRLWDELNSAGAWAANPWVWVIEFRRIEG